MKNKLLCILFLGILSAFIPGCSNDNFFDVQSAMRPPAFTKEQEKVKEAVGKHLNEDFTWEYPFVEGRYSPVNRVVLTDDGEIYLLLFCRPSGENHKIHMMILKQGEIDWKVIEDIPHTVSNIKKVYIRDIDKDGLNEIVVITKNFEDSYGSVYAYKYDNNHLTEIAVADNFFNEINENKANENI